MTGFDDVAPSNDSRTVEVPVGSRYLLKPSRTLREACCDISVAHPELIGWGCDWCLHRELCAISERIKRDRRAHVVKMKTKPLVRDIPT
jgi:hypothetical protein